MNKQYRFFFHYRRSTGGMSVHFKKICYTCKNIICNVPVETKYHDIQPHLTLQGMCKELIVNDDTITIQ